MSNIPNYDDLVLRFFQEPSFENLKPILNPENFKNIVTEEILITQQILTHYYII